MLTTTDDNSGNITNLSDTFNNFHDYEIRWTPDNIQWLVDGQVGRTVNRKDHWNATSNQWSFPQTPARVQISIWPGGLASNAPGTIAWAGGEIDWNAPDIQNAGYFYATFESVTVDCYNATSGLGSNSGTSYTYSNIAGTNNTVVDGNKRTNLASLEGTGTDMDAGKPDTSSAASSATGSATKSSSTPKNTQAQIPGGSNGSSGTVPGGDSGSSSNSGSNSGSSSGGSSGSSGDSGSGSSSGGSAPADTSGCSSTSFNQDCSSGSSSSNTGKSGKNAGSQTGVSSLAMVLAGAALFLF